MRRKAQRSSWYSPLRSAPVVLAEVVAGAVNPVVVPFLSPSMSSPIPTSIRVPVVRVTPATKPRPPTSSTPSSSAPTPAPVATAPVVRVGRPRLPLQRLDPPRKIV